MLFKGMDYDQLSSTMTLPFDDPYYDADPVIINY